MLKKAFVATLTILVSMLLFSPVVRAQSSGQWNDAIRGKSVQTTYAMFPSKQNETMTTSATVTIALTPDGPHAASITYFGINTSGSADTLWIYTPSYAAKTDSVYVLCYAGTITTTGVFIGKGDTFRFGKGSAGTPDLLIEGPKN